MSATLAIEDIIVALLFMLLMVLAKESLRRQLEDAGYQRREASSRSKRFFLYATGYIVVFMVCGVLHQTRTLLGWPAYMIFSLLIVGGAWGWLRLRRVSPVRGAG